VDLRAGAPVVLPSLLLCDFGNLEREVRRLEEAGVRGLHLDVMDGHFVPNLTYGMPLVAAFRKLTPLPLDVHLMISAPDRYIPQFLDAGADSLTIHVEAAPEPTSVLQQIRAGGAAAGLAINPGTPATAVEPFLSSCDLILVMSVNPGFGGQAFDAVALDKLSYLSERIGSEQLLEVDGGVSPATIERCSAAGAHLFVVGSAVFGTPDYHASVCQLEEQARQARSTPRR
jgi:ribulose-phosphate 3-epimerase